MRNLHLAIPIAPRTPRSFVEASTATNFPDPIPNDAMASMTPFIQSNRPRGDEFEHLGHGTRAIRQTEFVPVPLDTERNRPKKETISWMDLPSKDQLFLLALCRLSEPLSNVCLLPYIFYLVRSVLDSQDTTSSSTSPTPEDSTAAIATYSGLLVASFPLAQCVVSLPWGRFSDARGRRASILAGLAISATANAAFGLSRSFTALICWRVIAGLANGNVGIMRTVTAEVVVERKFQTKAFLLLPLVFNSGMVLSLALGGALADPVANLPWFFGPHGVFNFSGDRDGVAWARMYPYALPALLNATVLSFALGLAVLFLRETLPGREDHVDIGIRAGRFLVRLARRVVGQRDHAEYFEVADTDDEFRSSASSSPSFSPSLEKPNQGPRSRLPFRKIWTRDVLTSLFAFGLLPLHNAAFMHIFPVYLSAPPSPNTDATILAFTGGLGLHASTIGLWLAAFGVAGVLLQLFIYPRMQARIGTLGVFRISLVLFPLVYAFAPYLSLLPADSALRWVCLGAVICLQIAARTMAIPSTVILLTEAAPAKNVLGTVHGAGNMLASLARAVGPAAGGFVFAWGVKAGVVGAVWWLYLAIVSIVALVWTFIMQRPKEEED